MQGCLPHHPPVVVLKAWSPVRRSQQGLNSTGKIHKKVAHEEKPVEGGKQQSKSSGHFSNNKSPLYDLL